MDNAEESVSAPSKPSPPRLSFGAFTLGLILIVVLGAVLFFRSGAGLYFPTLPTGTFVGQLKFDGSDSVYPLYIESDRTANTVLLGVLAPDWSPQLLSVGEETDGNGIPVLVQSPLGTIRLTGETVEARFHGAAEILETHRSGEWSLAPLLQGNELGQGDGGALWLRLRDELDVARSAAVEMERKVKSATARLEEISTLVTDSAALKKKTAEADSRLNESLRTLKAELKTQRMEMRNLAQQVEGQRRVTGRGKLVQLSRDLLERQDRWLDSMFRAGGGDIMGSEDMELHRAERILELRRAISEERQRLGLGVEQAPLGGRDSAPFADIFQKGRR